MKYTLTIAAFAALAAAQSIADLPSCSISCVANGVTGIGCGLTDFECSCKAAAQLTPAVTPCVQAACTDAADQAKVITVLEGICSAAGFPINVPEPTSEPTSAAPEEPSVAPTIQTSTSAPSPTEAPVYPSALPTSAAADDTCAVTTITVTETVSKPVSPPYPTGPSKPSGPAPSGTAPTGTGVYTTSPPLFTGAAAAVKVPAGIAGILGLAAFVL